jgi:hypothetical protein
MQLIAVSSKHTQMNWKIRRPQRFQNLGMYARSDRFWMSGANRT